VILVLALGIVQATVETDNESAAEHFEIGEKTEELDDIDSNGDGNVSHQELYHWFRDLRAFHEDEDVNEYFEHADFDGNGDISIDEALGFTEEHDRCEDPKLREKRRLLHSDNMFMLCDEDKNSLLDIEEFGVYLNSFNEPFMRPKMVELALNKYDTNKDQFLNYCEINPCENDKEPNMLDIDFVVYFDTDGDKKLNSSEILNWVYYNADMEDEITDQMENTYIDIGYEVGSTVPTKLIKQYLVIDDTPEDEKESGDTENGKESENDHDEL